jgi:hypothetical protein
VSERALPAVPQRGPALVRQSASMPHPIATNPSLNTARATLQKHTNVPCAGLIC